MDGTRPSKYNQPQGELTPDDIIEQLNIRYRVCHYFAQITDKRKRKYGSDSGELCECGLEKSEHKPYLEDSTGEWRMRENTLERINPAHGQLTNKAWYVRLAQDTPLIKVEKILLEAWKIPKPRFIVSIIGGAKYFKLSDQLETNFINGIVDIAQKSDAWLLTSGYNVGIVQLVGQAINKVKFTNIRKQIIAIGICKWGSILDRDNLTRPKKEEIEQETTDTKNKIKKKRQSGERDLEMNHSHYLMLDDGTIRDYDTKQYRTRLAIYMARLQHENDVVIPVVTIVVEGGKDTIANVFYDLEQNIPVVLVAGSGRAADFLHRWLLNTKNLETDPKKLENVHGIDELVDDLDRNKRQTNKRNSGYSNAHSKTPHINSQWTKLEDLFVNHINIHQLDEDLKQTLSLEKTNNLLLRQVMYCLQPAVRSDITVFNLNSDNDLSETIFRSICQSRQKLSKRKENQQNDLLEMHQERFQPPPNPKRKEIELKARFRISRKEEKSQRSRLLDLAMNWNCIDVAKEFIFRNSLDNILNKITEFKNALQKNLPTFVYEFLRLNIDVAEVFLPKNDLTLKHFRYKIFLSTLYTIDAVSHDETHLKCFVDSDVAESKKKIDSVEKLNNTLTKLIGDYMHKLYFDSLREENQYRIDHGLIKKNISLSEEENQYRIDHGLIKKNISLSEEENEEVTTDYIMRDLFIWSVLMNYTEMAKVLLSHMKYRICPALIATKILKQYHEKAPYGSLKDKYLESANDFEQYAINCLDKCDDYDVDLACEIILQRNELYGYVNCLQVAHDAKDKLFIAAPCCVQAVNNVWYDKLHPERTEITDRVSLLIGYVSLGLAAPIFVTYRTAKKEVKMIDSSDQRLRSNGINYSDVSLLEYFILPPSYSSYDRYFPQLKKFHQSLPTKFCYHLITYCFFLLLFSYVLLFNFNPPTNQTPSIHWTEILTIILVSIMLIEEIHYFFGQDNLSWAGRIQSYLNHTFKPMIFLGFVLFYIGLIVRFKDADSQVDFTAARIIMAIDLEIWWLCSLSFIIVISFLGPHLVAIKKMLKDLIFFTFVIAIVMIGYGVASRSLVYYPIANGFTTATGGSIDPNFDGRSVFHQVLYPVYYFLYGQFTDELANLDSNPNAGWSIATEVLLAIHMMFVNILLINLLIAMFSKRFDQVYDDTQNIWHSQKYSFTREYYTRSPFFPPISLIYDIYYLCRMFVFYIRRVFFHKSADYKAKVFQIISKKNSIIKEWREFEERCTYEYAHNEVKALKAKSAKSKSRSESNEKDEQENKSKSTSESESNKKEKQENIYDDDNDPNKTVDDLKKVEETLVKLTSMIDQMREDLKQQKQPNK